MDQTQPATDPARATPGPSPDRSVVRRLWDVFRREPMLLVTCSYLFVSVVGLGDSYWFYRQFDVPILEYMQSSDYFVAGLRRPIYLVLLAWTLVVSWWALWPERWREKHPERAARLDRRWWFRALAPRRGDWWAYFGLHPETMATVTALVVMGLLLFSYSGSRAGDIRAGGGNPVVVEAGASTLPGDWRMLGTSSAFVFLWEADARQSRVVPIEALGAIRPLRPTGEGDATRAGGDNDAPPTPPPAQ